jgi:hypothetical protein
MKVAVLGMGAMDRAVASRLLNAGDQLPLWNRSAEKANELVARGAVESRSPRDAAQGAEVVVCSLTDDAAIRGALLDGDEPSLPVNPGSRLFNHFARCGSADRRRVSRPLRFCADRWHPRHGRSRRGLVHRGWTTGGG